MLYSLFLQVRTIAESMVMTMYVFVLYTASPSFFLVCLIVLTFDEFFLFFLGLFFYFVVLGDDSHISVVTITFWSYYYWYYESGMCSGNFNPDKSD